MSDAGAGAIFVLFLWTLWLLVALSLHSELRILRRAAARVLPRRLITRGWIRRFPIFAYVGGDVKTNAVGLGGTNQASAAKTAAKLVASYLPVLFVVIGPVLMLTPGITWRSYLMAWLAIHAIVAAAMFASDRQLALALSTVSCVGLVWVWFLGGEPDAQDMLVVELPAVGGLIVAATAYGLIFGLAAIHGQAETRQQLRDAHEQIRGSRHQLDEAHQELREGQQELTASRGQFSRERVKWQALKDELTQRAVALENEVMSLERTRQGLVTQVQDLSQRNEAQTDVIAHLQRVVDAASVTGPAVRKPMTPEASVIPGEQHDETGKPMAEDVYELDPFTSVVVGVENDVAAKGWGQATQIFALVDSTAVSGPDSATAAGAGQSPPGSLKAIEQPPLPPRELSSLLDQLSWPAEVKGCVLVTELIMLPPEAEADAPRVADEREKWARQQPGAYQARLAIGVLRDNGQRSSCLRVEGQENLIVDTDPADELAVALLGTFLPHARPA